MRRIETIAEGVTLYLGDCREIVPRLPFHATVITDPPYPDYHAEIFQFDPFALSQVLDAVGGHQFVFWSATAYFPLLSSAVHIWHKTGAGNIASYERIFERNGQKANLVFTGNPISNPTMARFAKDELFGHPTQKPLSLLLQIVDRTMGDVIDPFMGSGTTGAACIKRGRPFTGIEINAGYFDIACKRISDALKQPDFFVESPKLATEQLDMLGTKQR